MRLTIDHRTRYQFSEPQARVVQLLRMTPQDFGGQTVIDWRIDVDCDARLREGRDGYGNVTTMLYIDGPIYAVSIMVRGDVLTDDLGGRVAGTQEPLPPLFFTRTTPLTEADEAILALAPTGQPCLDHADALNRAIHAAIRLEPGRTPKSRTAAQVMADRRGSARDCTHVLLAAARAAGYPSRLVSGHCLDGPNSGSHKSAHCWAELWVPDAGWIAFDPSAGRQPGDTYVRVAVGLDASDSTPLSGTRRGGGIEELDVEVLIAMSQSQS